MIYPLSIRTHIAILIGKGIDLTISIFHLGGGTAAPGLYALKVQRNLLEELCKQHGTPSIVITGTNGKTTTSRLISHFFSQKKINHIHNRTGSNLERGIVSEILRHTRITGSVAKIDYMVWEIDEAEFSRSLLKINPTTIVMLNLFRDQLDRYGEVDATRRKWEKAINELTVPTSIIYNCDDPQLVELINTVKKEKPTLKTTAFSIEGETQFSQTSLLNPLDLTLCPQCNSRLLFTAHTIAGQGRFKCQSCQLTNSRPDIYIKEIKQSSSGFEFNAVHNSKSIYARTSLMGMFNLYNYVAALATLINLGNDLQDIVATNALVREAFGRMEKIQYQGRVLLIALIKNPTGTYEVLRTIFHDNFHSNVAAFILNDNFADGKDISWIWDVLWGKNLKNFQGKIIVGGSRVFDLATRLEYADIPAARINIAMSTRDLMENIIENSQPGETIPLLMTYTALLEYQKLFEKIGVKKIYWEE